MTTLNTKKVDDEFQYNPFAEYSHPQEEVVQQESVTTVVPIEKGLQQGKEELMKNIDNVFDGADFMLSVANHIFKRLGGK